MLLFSLSSSSTSVCSSDSICEDAVSIQEVVEVVLIVMEDIGGVKVMLFSLSSFCCLYFCLYESDDPRVCNLREMRSERVLSGGIAISDSSSSITAAVFLVTLL